eukprot:CAMPEP_0118965432 /NCGR_PEP_ID=MMETSP1173-20130426/3008_1 /TAXON_ID=1034831 /ORGANISM="Rhizochromulina marina cf, Strain CCMP1243" /LENGTH=33 /DNA_ID= /DNA_START= /DNA_END= /DNA_ORIENTATION=
MSDDTNTSRAPSRTLADPFLASPTKCFQRSTRA